MNNKRKMKKKKSSPNHFLAGQVCDFFSLNQQEE
jgi:hypothetical protein